MRFTVLPGGSVRKGLDLVLIFTLHLLQSEVVLELFNLLAPGTLLHRRIALRVLRAGGRGSANVAAAGDGWCTYRAGGSVLVAVGGAGCCSGGGGVLVVGGGGIAGELGNPRGGGRLDFHGDGVELGVPSALAHIVANLGLGALVAVPGEEIDSFVSSKLLAVKGMALVSNV